MKPQLIDIIAVGNTLGEGVQWDDEAESLWWTDIQSRLLYRYHLPSGRLSTFPTPERLCSFGFVENSTNLIVAFERGFALYNPVSGDTRWLARPDAVGHGVRFNDGKVDCLGRFWAGTMVEDDDPLNRPEGILYSFNNNFELYQHETGIGISNGICWSPDSTRLYFADSARRIIYSYDFERNSGMLDKRRIFVETGHGAFPDGAEIDSDGCLWSAHWGAGRIVRYTPSGKTDAVLTLPVSQPTCVTFGGHGYELLFITSAREGLGENILNEQPLDGNVFVFKVGVSGFPARRFIQTVNVE